MNKEESIYFAGLMEDYLNIPSFICESIEQDLINGKYKEVIEYIIQRKNEQKEREQINIDGSIEKNKPSKVTFEVNADTNIDEFYRFMITNISFEKVLRLHELLESRIRGYDISKDVYCCELKEGKNGESKK